MGLDPLPGTHPRALTVNHLRQVVSKARGFKLDDDPDPLLPNRMRLFSYYKPSLEAGLYSIEAEQIINSDEHVKDDVKKAELRIHNHKFSDLTLDPLKLNAVTPQQFNVVTPQFSLDEKLINSYYPPDGHQDEARILPHLVFNDPHVPWERDAGVTIAGEMDPDLGDDKKPILKDGKPVFRSMVPWFALLVFDPVELRLEQAEVEALKIPGFVKPLPDMATALAKRAATCDYPMSIAEYLSMPIASRVNYEAGYQTNGSFNSLWNGDNGLVTDPSPTKVIFPKKSLFRDIFTSADGQSHNIASHKYMCHVRQVNTIGFPDAGVEAKGLFSIAVSRRAGNINLTKPEPQIVHLVSIEHLDSTWPSVDGLLKTQPDSAERIGLVSLKSWIYTALPPDPINFIDTMSNLMKTQQMLRVNDRAFANLQSSLSAESPPDSSKQPAATNAANQVLNRLKLGYTMARWRAETGEEVAAFNRGPLVPQQVHWPPMIDWAGSSNTSKEYQILDKQTGIMDLSYSSAWQLGKLLAISDSTFNAALMRFRSLVHAKASSRARKQVNDMASRAATIKAFADAMGAIKSVASGVTGVPQRTRPVRTDGLTTSLDNTELLESFRQQLDSIVDFQGSAEDEIYNEFNKAGANNSDWVVIFNWISEKLYLSGIPAHFLIPDPSYLPAEALRFFFIDDAWLDCLIDGALSAANHLEGDDDFTRLRIKQTYNVYLDKTVSDTNTKPQIPRSGFILRSALVKVMPDMRITVKWKVPDANRQDVCRYTKLDDSTLLCLLDRLPEELESITLSQPPHQQRFSVGYDLEPVIPASKNADGTEVPGKPGVVKFQLRQLFTKTDRVDEEWPALPRETKPTAAEATQWFDFKSRCIRASEMASGINILLQTGTQKTDEYKDLVPTSTVLGLELNDPSYYFVIVPQVPKARRPRHRQLWIGTKPPAPPPANDNDSNNKKKNQSPSKPESTFEPASQGPVVSNRPLPDRSKLTAPSKIPIAPRTDQTLDSFNKSRGVGIGTTTTATNYFLVTIWADYKPAPLKPKRNILFSPEDYIPTGNKYFFDLTISVRRRVASNPTMKNVLLKEIGIALPTDGLFEIDPSTKQDSLLEKTYDGPGPYMISNQRFVPYLNATRDYLQIRLVPRSASSSPFIALDDDRTREISVRLGEANISRYNRDKERGITVEDLKVPAKQRTERRTVAVCPVYERYADPRGGADLIARDTVLVVKKDGADEGR